mgnify:CR=1 FL=1
MEKIPIAEEVYNQHCFVNDISSSMKRAMIEFAKLHVTEALKQASIKVQTRYSTTYPEEAEMNIIQYVDEKSILNAYSLDNIK